ncbi:carbonic anhydrase [Paenibacillus sp. F411]|uniref:beta-class carbonic anhydrase n=1 Tax=unclassified Paenibacillus TaxID=185978 RepID=UPI001AAF37D4|nr:carbonic anhydrase [Paenibacillus sp. F411]MBO2943071.1 carbonic anhydrase [Paenibacillus sp. F411]
MTTQLSSIMEHNRKFVQDKQYEAYETSKLPDKKTLIVTCMDTRLVELLPKAMNFKNGDIKIIKTAGAIVSNPFGSAMRSILVGLYELNVEEVIVVGHHECGMASLNSERMVSSMKERGVSDEVLSTLDHSGIKLDEWLRGFDNVTSAVENTVSLIKNHPLLPRNTPVHGMVIHPATGALDLVVEGYSAP